MKKEKIKETKKGTLEIMYDCDATCHIEAYVAGMRIGGDPRPLPASYRGKVQEDITHMIGDPAIMIVGLTTTEYDRIMTTYAAIKADWIANTESGRRYAAIKAEQDSRDRRLQRARDLRAELDEQERQMMDDEDGEY